MVFNDQSLSDLMPWFSHEQLDFFQRKEQELGYVFLDLTPSLQVATQMDSMGELIYFPRNLHLTVTGHSVVAARIRETILRLEILPVAR